MVIFTCIWQIDTQIGKSMTEVPYNRLKLEIWNVQFFIVGL